MNRRLLLAIPLSCLPLAFAACGSDGASGTLQSAQTLAAQTAAAGGSASTPNPSTEPNLSAPVNRYTITLDDTGTNYLTDPASPFETSLEDLAASGKFKDRATGLEQLQLWNYLEGYEADLVPEGRENAVLNGALYITIESHLFGNLEGAKTAYTYFDVAMKGAQANRPAQIPAIGSQSVAYVSTPGDKISTSSINATYQQILVRRGNLVYIISTYGAEGFSKLDYPIELARLVDLRALGTEPVIEPTPHTNFTPPPGAGTASPRITPGQTPIPSGTTPRTPISGN